MQIRSKVRYKVQTIVGCVFLAASVLLRFAFHDNRFLPVFLGVVGVWLLVHTLRGIQRDRPGTESWHRKRAAVGVLHP